MTPVYLNELGIICALGTDKQTVRTALLSPSRLDNIRSIQLPQGMRYPCAPVQNPLVSIERLPQQYRSRNNALLLTALVQIQNAVEAAINQFGANRVAIILGTSTSGIGESEQAFQYRQEHGIFPKDFHPLLQELGSPATMLSQYLGTRHIATVISTACSSSAKAMASAARMLQANLCDAVLCGGVDSLCQFTVAGFSALDSVSQTGCNPMSINRDGIHIGEAAALFLMTKTPSEIALYGYGESADAHHISAPDPRGQGAYKAMALALKQAELSARDIDYINLHGTATEQNDAMESLAVSTLFGHQTPASSTKPLTGHTLGAAGALEAGLAWLTLKDNPRHLLPPHHWDGKADPSLSPLMLVQPNYCLPHPPRYLLSNSFAFGGSNTALILGKTTC